MTELLLFAKFWEPGRVKTRLARVLGEAFAADTYRQFVDVSLQRLASIGDRRSVVYWPPDRKDAFARLALERGWDSRPQNSGPLGERLYHAMSEAMDQGADAVVLLGSDSPNLPREFVEQAIQWLQQVDVVIGPAADGGYYLFATRVRCREPFMGVEWSSPQVLEQTLASLRRMDPKPRWALLPTWYDVDEEADLRRLWDDLRTMDTKRLQSEGLQSLADSLKQLFGDPTNASARNS